MIKALRLALTGAALLAAPAAWAVPTTYSVLVPSSRPLTATTAAPTSL